MLRKILGLPKICEKDLAVLDQNIGGLDIPMCDLASMCKSEGMKQASEPWSDGFQGIGGIPILTAFVQVTLEVAIRRRLHKNAA